MKLIIRVVPRSSKNEIVGIMADGRLKVKLMAPPVEGAANDALIELLTEEYKRTRSQVRIVKGQKSKNKVVVID